MKRFLQIGALVICSRAWGDCSEMEVWDFSTAMCQPLAMSGMSMSMLMLHGSIFGVQSFQSGLRGRNAFAAPSMLMADLGKNVGDAHYLSADLMLTFERWTFPERGYPLFGQIGERNAQGQPYLDAQHPHSSPIMGLTLSDTISLGGEKNYLKVFFAPRGESTDGPIAFMHRVTSAYNPDAPLGHHVGQDVGHISSTVLGASLKLGDWHVEASGFHGAEPEPTKVDLPMGALNSFGLRLIYEFNPAMQAMISYARVGHPEPDEPSLDSRQRYSASIYNSLDLPDGWTFNNALIAGLITHMDDVSQLASYSEEFLFKGPVQRMWARIELLQRSAGELQIGGLSADETHWMSAITLGTAHKLTSFGDFDLDLGASVTNTLLPSAYRGAYGGDPWTARLFVRLGGMQMRDL